MISHLSRGIYFVVSSGVFPKLAILMGYTVGTPMDAMTDPFVVTTSRNQCSPAIGQHFWDDLPISVCRPILDGEHQIA